jgi:hypothetical protein
MDRKGDAMRCEVYRCGVEEGEREWFNVRYWVRTRAVGRWRGRGMRSLARGKARHRQPVDAPRPTVRALPAINWGLRFYLARANYGMQKVEKEHQDIRRKLGWWGQGREGGGGGGGRRGQLQVGCRRPWAWRASERRTEAKDDARAIE